MDKASVRSLARALSQIETAPDLRDGLLDLTKALGFGYCGLLHVSPERSLFSFNSFPEHWNEEFERKEYWRDEPVAQLARMFVTPFTWDLVGKLWDLTPHQTEALKASRAAGVANGFTAPLFGRGSIPAVMHFATLPGEDMPTDNLVAAHHLSAFAYEALLRVGGEAAFDAQMQKRIALEGPIEWSARQIECATLVARGLSDKEAAIKLGISPDTVHKHVQQAMRKAGVTTRVQLLVRLLNDGVITFGEVYRR